MATLRALPTFEPGAAHLPYDMGLLPMLKSRARWHQFKGTHRFSMRKVRPVHAGPYEPERPRTHIAIEPIAALCQANLTMGRLIPPAVSRSIHDLHRRVVFEQAMRRFMNDPVRAAQFPSRVLDQLVSGWGNPGWSGHAEYLQACIVHAFNCTGPILECGSGLTTLLVGHVARLRGLGLWSLEHMPEWAARVQRSLDRYGITSVRLWRVPIQNHGQVDWYDAPLHAMPQQFSLVICDGPPASTRGGRYGLSVVLRQRLAADCTVLLDDASRTEETRVAAQWASELNMVCERRGVQKPYFLLVRSSAESRPD